MKEEGSIRAILVVAATCLLCAGAATADPTWLGGEGPPFAFVADGTGAVRPGDTLTIVLSVGGRQPSDPPAAFQLSIPAGLTFLSGDTAQAGLLSAVSGNHTLKVVLRKPGRYEIAGSFRVDGEGQRDRAGFLMPITVGTDTIITEHSHYTLLETIRAGRRYRYGDWWLVPLDSTEVPVVEREIEVYGKRARAARLPSPRCRGCKVAAGMDSVRFVVMLGADGRVRDLRLLPSSLGSGQPEPAAVEAARTALHEATFEAARARGTPVSDWLYVTVPVRH